MEVKLDVAFEWEKALSAWRGASNPVATSSTCEACRGGTTGTPVEPRRSTEQKRANRLGEALRPTEATCGRLDSTWYISSRASSRFGRSPPVQLLCCGRCECE